MASADYIGTSFPAKFKQYGTVLRTDQGILYINNGSFGTPDFQVLADSGATPNFIGTGAEIAALSPVAGQVAICTSTGSGFTKDVAYVRNAANTLWRVLGKLPGEIIAYGGLQASPAPGFLLCDGSAVSRTTYADLFAIVSTRFGVGDGSTTFNLPDLRGKFPRGAPAATEAGGTGGADTVTLVTSEIPTHTHNVSDPGHGHSISGAIGNANSNQGPQLGTIVGNVTNKSVNNSTTGVSVGNVVGTTGQAHNNIPSYQHVQWVIAI